MSFWVLVHVIGFVAWIGGGLSVMLSGITAKNFPPDQRLAVYRIMGVVTRSLVAPGSVDELCGGLVGLARDPALRLRLANSARERIEQEYTFERRMRRELRLYDRLMGSDGS